MGIPEIAELEVRSLPWLDGTQISLNAEDLDAPDDDELQQLVEA